MLDRQLEAIAEAHVKIALKGQEEATRAKVQAGILKGRGVLVDSQQVEQHGAVEHIIRIVREPVKELGDGS